MEGALQITHQLLQAFAPAPGGRQVIGDHSRVAQIQQESRLLRGEAEEVLIVVVDNFHPVRRLHKTVVGRNPDRWMGKAGIWSGRGSFLQGLRFIGSTPSGISGRLGRCMEPGGDFHHHQPEEGHGDQQRARVGHVTSPKESRTLKQILRTAGLLGERPKNCTSRNKTRPPPSAGDGAPINSPSRPRTSPGRRCHCGPCVRNGNREWDRHVIEPDPWRPGPARSRRRGNSANTDGVYPRDAGGSPLASPISRWAIAKRVTESMRHRTLRP